MRTVYFAIPLLPLVGAIFTGLWCRWIERAVAHWVATLSVAASCILSLFVLNKFIFYAEPAFNQSLYTWMVVDELKFEIGFLVDQLTAVMISVVTFVSLMVHIYTVGYMAHEEGYQRFFSYISLFTFSMLMLVMSNNFLQLFFGWEAVGLVSYLLIGFYFRRESAISANLKAFLVNRVGDFGFVLGISAIAMTFNSLDYNVIFTNAPNMASSQLSIIGGRDVSLMSLICVLLFIGAMGKSAQVPLHVWLPDSMEGPTPISALIHAATMVTAGIFMVTRMSPLFELSETALSVVLVVGATTAFFMGLVGIVQNDIKRVVAYSTLSQLGVMMVALGASAYAAGIFHLVTHAFFKALLFLASGSVIIAMHHDQDIRNMGGLAKHMPLTYVTMLLGSLALIGMPGFSGFYSKDLIIEAVYHSKIPGSFYAYLMVIGGVFVTALYSFRMFFLVFHGKSRMDEHTRASLRESAPVIIIPLCLLAVPSVIIGSMSMEMFLFDGFWRQSIFVLPDHDVLHYIGGHFHGILQFTMHGLFGLPFFLAALGVMVSAYIYLYRLDAAENLRKRFVYIYNILDHKYGLDDLYQLYIAGTMRSVGMVFWQMGDIRIIDGLIINSSASNIVRLTDFMRKVQAGLLYQYAFIMILGLICFLFWFVIV